MKVCFFLSLKQLFCKCEKEIKNMKLGVIGSGIIVQEFLPELVKLEGIEIKAIQGMPSDKENMEKMAAENNIPNVIYSFDEMKELDVDTVYVAVPNFLHFMYCKQALEAGLNVIVEKPMTSNLREAEALQKMAEEKGLYLFEAITTVYFDSYAKIREWLKEIGTVKLVNCNYSQYSRRYDDFRKGAVLPVFDPKKSGGALMDLNLYNLHFVMGLFGKPKSAKYYANIERGIDTSGELVMEYDGFLANCTAAKDCEAPRVFVIQGTDGYISTQYSPNLIGEVTLHRNDGTEEKYDDGMAMKRLIPEFRYFIQCINSRDHASCMKMLQESVDVSAVQTKARLEAGIVFPADE